MLHCWEQGEVRLVMPQLLLPIVAILHERGKTNLGQRRERLGLGSL